MYMSSDKTYASRASLGGTERTKKRISLAMTATTDTNTINKNNRRRQ